MKIENLRQLIEKVEQSDEKPVKVTYPGVKDSYNYFGKMEETNAILGVVQNIQLHTLIEESVEVDS